jgi:hypothetical protein
MSLSRACRARKERQGKPVFPVAVKPYEQRFYLLRTAAMISFLAQASLGALGPDQAGGATARLLGTAVFPAQWNGDAPAMKASPDVGYHVDEYAHQFAPEDSTWHMELQSGRERQPT